MNLPDSLVFLLPLINPTKLNSLQEKLHSFVQIEAESLSRKYELDEISQRVEEKKLVLSNMLMQAKVVEEHAKTKDDHLSGEIRSLLVLGNFNNFRKKTTGI